MEEKLKVVYMRVEDFTQRFFVLVIFLELTPNME